MNHSAGFSLQRRAILHFKGNDPDHLQSLRTGHRNLSNVLRAEERSIELR